MTKISRFLFLCLSALMLLPLAVRAAEAPGATLPEPASPSHAVLEDGRVEVFVGTNLPSDYQIGDSIPIRVIFILTPEAMIKARQQPAPVVVPGLVPPRSDPEAEDRSAKMEEPKALDIPMVEVEGLKMGVLSDQPSDVEPLGPVTVDQYIRPDHTKMVVAGFYVSPYVNTLKTQVDVVFTYMYATSVLPDGQPNWVSASTPTLSIGLTKSATDNQTLLLEGDQSAKASPVAAAAPWLLFGSDPLALPMIGALVLMVYWRANRQRNLSKNERTWLILDSVVAGAAGAFEIEHYRQIFFAIREHLDVLGMDTTQTLSALGHRPDLSAQAVDVVFNQETLFFDPAKTITAEQHRRLMSAIAVLIPRH